MLSTARSSSPHCREEREAGEAEEVGRVRERQSVYIHICIQSIITANTCTCTSTIRESFNGLI